MLNGFPSINYCKLKIGFGERKNCMQIASPFYRILDLSFSNGKLYTIDNLKGLPAG
jgi:hypothetical protein